MMTGKYFGNKYKKYWFLLFTYASNKNQQISKKIILMFYNNPSNMSVEEDMVIEEIIGRLYFIFYIFTCI